MQYLLNDLDDKEMNNFYFDLIQNEHSVDEYKKIIKDITGIELPANYENFYIAPASTKFHGSHKCGLIQHSLAVYYFALRLAKAFNMEQRDVNPIACIFHDFCKVNMYIPGTGYKKYEYNTNIINGHHGTESVLRLAEIGYVLPENWRTAVIYHMGAFTNDDKERNTYASSCAKYKEVLLLHTADMMATNLLGI